MFDWLLLNHNVPPPPPPHPLFAAGDLKNFQCWPKGGDLHFFEFLGGSELKGESGFFQGGPDDFLKVISNC